jgi:hypothetical protein
MKALPLSLCLSAARLLLHSKEVGKKLRNHADLAIINKYWPDFLYNSESGNQLCKR